MAKALKLIGREKEQEILKEALESDEAEMVSVIGRRRVGKTYLIKSTYKDHIIFELTGVKQRPLEEQLKNFTRVLNRMAKNLENIPQPQDWQEAFFALTDRLEELSIEQKYVIFLDELPWLAVHQAEFIGALSFFWNSWAVNQNIVVVLCGSSASWIIQKIVNDRGGLHNRITRRLDIKPFTLSETELYLKSRKINLSRQHILQLFMAMGGIPHYLKEIKKAKSATQNIDDICFSGTGLLSDEFTDLYSSLFDDSHNHIAVIRCQAARRSRPSPDTIG